MQMKNFWKSVLFIFLFCALFSLATILVLNKTERDTKGFYQQRENSIDVLFVGSSHAFCSFSPILMYQELGFTGCIRASSCQRSWESYTLLEESFKYQKPKVVVYEVMSAFQGEPQYEAFSREIYDTMRPSMTKVKGIAADIDGSEDLDYLSMYIPMVRYHERWKSLEKKDFTYMSQKNLLPYKGYQLSFDIDPATEYDAEMYNREMEVENCTQKSEDYIRKMKALCDEYGTAFVMVKTPTVYESYWDVGKSYGMQKLAEELGVPFIDYNMGDNAIYIDWSKETCDKGNHLNHYGAEKVTRAFGKWIDEKYDLPDHRDDEAYLDWQTAGMEYELAIAKIKLKETGDYLAYMDYVNDYFAQNEDFVVFITAKSNILECMQQEHTDKLVKLGDDLNYTGPGARIPNIFICCNKQIVEKKQQSDGIIEDYTIGGHHFKVDCQNTGDMEVCDIYADGQLVGMNAIGLNIVIYDLKNEQVLDSCYAKFDEQQFLNIYRY